MQYAITNNIVVVFAAGNTASHYSCNDNGYVAFPANADIDYLLTVGASDRNDRQADYSPTSSLIDIVAPSHKAYPPVFPYCGGIYGETGEMWTLDIPGNAGYNPWPSSPKLPHPPLTGETLPPYPETDWHSYTGRFGGTSHACPVVAGAAALILSEHPNMTPQQIFDILTGSSDKIASNVYTYTNGRSNETGFGRVNAYEALMHCNTFDFTNHTISTNTTIEDCNINVQNVAITNNSKLTINATNNVTINGEFEVALGSELEIP